MIYKECGGVDWDAQLALDLKHATDPTPGDYWHEMFCPIRVVVKVTNETVHFCETTRVTDGNCWTWDLTKITRVFKDQFSDRLRYQSDGMRNKFWCNVCPGLHKVFADAFVEGRLV